MKSNLIFYIFYSMFFPKMSALTAVLINLNVLVFYFRRCKKKLKKIEAIDFNLDCFLFQI